MIDTTVEEILRRYKCRATSIRKKILSFLSTENKAFAISEIEEFFFEADRVTIYRTLNVFVEKRLVTKMLNSKGVAYYLYNGDKHGAKEAHPHLYCKSCQKVICLPEYSEDYFEALDSYNAAHISVLLEGQCETCR